MSSDELLLDEAELAWRKARALELMDELGILPGPIRDEMTADPARAVAVLQRAKGSPGIRNPAALAISNWRRGADPRPRAPRSDELVEEAPLLETIEHAWSLETAISNQILRMMSAAIGRTGGFRPVLERAGLKPERERRLFD